MGACFGRARRLMALFVGFAVAGSALGQELDWLWKAPMMCGPVETASFSPNSELLATGHGGPASLDIKVRVWDMARHRLKFELTGDSQYVCRSLAFSPDGRYLAAAYSVGWGYTGTLPGILRIWDLVNGESVVRRVFPRALICVKYSPDGSQLAVSGLGPLELLNSSTAATEFAFPTVPGVISLAYSPDGSQLAAGRYTSSGVQFINPNTGNLLDLKSLPPNGQVLALAYSPDGLFLFVCASVLAHMIETSTRSILWSISPEASAVTFSTDGSTIALGLYRSISSPGAVLLVDPLTRAMTSLVQNLPGRVSSVAFSAGGQSFVFASGATAYIYSFPDRQLREVYEGHGSNVVGCAISPNGKWFLGGDTSGSDPLPRLWLAATGENVAKFTGNHNIGTNVAVFSPNSELICSSDRGIPIWDIGTTALIRDILPMTSSKAIAFSPVANEIAVQNSIRNPFTGAQVRTLTGQVEANCFAFSGDGLLLAGGGTDSAVRLWNPATGSLLRTMTGHAAAVDTVGISPNQAIIASGSRDHTIKIWNTLTGSLIQTIIHPGQVTSLAFTPDGAFLYSACTDGLIRAWRTDNWSLDQSYAGTGANAISISQDGSLLGIAGRDATGLAFLHRPLLNGHIDFLDYSANPTTQPVTFDFLIDGLVYESANVTLDSNGDFSTTAKVAPGDYEVKARASHWLTKSLGVVTISRTTTGLMAQLTNGDSNGDNSVDIGDYALLSAAYGTSEGDPGFDPLADLNGDLSVDIGDYSILSANYGLNGD